MEGDNQQLNPTTLFAYESSIKNNKKTQNEIPTQKTTSLLVLQEETFLLKLSWSELSFSHS